MNETPESRPQKRDDIVAKSAGDEKLLYDPVSDTIHVLNLSAWTVWELCDGQHTPAQMEAALQAGYATGPERDLATDVAAVLQRLGDEGLFSGPS